jgi:hypothetical protein
VFYKVVETMKKIRWALRSAILEHANGIPNQIDLQVLQTLWSQP